MAQPRIAPSGGTAQLALVPRGGKTLAWVLAIAAGVIVLYWAVWFIIPGGRDALAVLPSDARYITFENAFPLADGWLAFSAALAAVQLLRGQANAILWLLMAASAGLYLSGMDILFDLENGVYPLITQATHMGAVITEMGINVATLGLSLYSLRWAMRHRTWNRS